jgi:glutamate 5-kinase
VSAGHSYGLVVVKVGSSTLVDASGTPDTGFISSLSAQIARTMEGGTRVILVSSGAVAAGMERLAIGSRPKDTPTLQACAAAGQARLTEMYADAFARHGLRCAQVLLTRGDTAERSSYLNARNTLERLLELGAVPVVNENDTVSTGELAFGDNDMLGAIVSSLAGADLYVVLSDVDGLYDSNPELNPEASVIRKVTKVDGRIMRMAGSPTSAVGTGGMRTKVRAARAMLAAGIPMVICRGRAHAVLEEVLSGREVGTRFEPANAGEGARKMWIGLAGISRGQLRVDDGAAKAVVEGGSSLLPVGVTAVEGDFEPGDIVGVVDGEGLLIGRGVVRYSSHELEKIQGLKLDVVARFYPDRADVPCIHRDELLVF